VNDVEVRSSHIQTEDGAGILVNGGGLTTRCIDRSLLGRGDGEQGTALWITDRADGGLAEAVQLEAVRSNLFGDVLVDGGSLQLSLADSSLWTLRGDSQRTRLANNGVVAFADPGLAGAFKQLQVSGDLEGDGHYIM